MSSEVTYIYKSDGTYLGFTKDDNVFSRDGVYLGWIESDYVWDSKGQFRGVLAKIEGNNYILTNRFVMAPPQRSPKSTPSTPVIPNPVPNIKAIELPIKLKDAF